MDNNSEKYIGMMLDDRYEILELIGSGGMANVYKALCHRLNRYDAIKIMRDETAENEDFRKRFRAESQAVAMLSHPNIVSVYDVSHTDDIEYIVMELIDGITLKQYMEQKGTLSAAEVESFSSQIAKALSHAHEKGIIHRDIKPHNIMLLSDGLIKVADFGIASLQNDIEGPTEEALGSVHYIAPEQARGFAPDARSDIYSLGIVMYEMLTGQLPYTGSDAVEIAVKHMNSEALPPSKLVSGIPEELERITMKAMAGDLNERYQNAQELLDDLENYHKSMLTAQMQANAAENEVNSVVQAGELTEEEYKKKKKRARSVAFNSGLFGILAFVVLLLVFLNVYLFKWLFSEPDRTVVADFVYKQSDIVINDPEYKKIYSFTIREVTDTENKYEEGEIIGQSPEAGKSIEADGELISVELTVSTKKDIAAELKPVPDVVNKEKTVAIGEIQSAGFEYTISEASSASITSGYVISTDPVPGESAPAGSTVVIVVSTGPEKVLVKVPNLKGLSKDAAIAKIESNNLSFGSVTYVESDYDEGTVIWQSVDDGTEVDARTKIYLQISKGPQDNGE